MGRTIPSWRIIVEQEIAAMSRFKQFLRSEDRTVFNGLLTQCKLYAAEPGVLVSPVEEVPLLLSMIFAQHKKLLELEKRLNETGEGWDARCCEDSSKWAPTKRELRAEALRNAFS